MSNVSVYAANSPPRVEIIIDGVIFVTKCITFSDAVRVAQQAVRVLGLAPLDPNIGVLKINGKPV